MPEQEQRVQLSQQGTQPVEGVGHQGVVEGRGEGEAGGEGGEDKTNKNEVVYAKANACYKQSKQKLHNNTKPITPISQVYKRRKLNN